MYLNIGILIGGYSAVARLTVTYDVFKSYFDLINLKVNVFNSNI